MLYDSIDTDICQELRESRYGEKKMRSEVIAGLVALYDPQKAQKLRECGTWLKFGAVVGTGRLSLLGANFCRLRICPMCQWRRSLALGYQMDIVYRLMLQDGRKHFAHVVFALKNSTADHLWRGIDQLTVAFRRLMTKDDLIPGIVVGYYRALEVTYNRSENTYHPHYHCIWLLPDDYYEGHYMGHEELLRRWKHAAQVDYDPVVHIQAVEGENLTSSLYEITKYTYKDSDIVDSDMSDEEKSDVLRTIDAALKGRRLISFGGAIKAYRQRMHMEDDLDKAMYDEDQTGAERYVFVWRQGVYIRYRPQD